MIGTFAGIFISAFIFIEIHAVNNVPVVHNHNRELRLNVGDHLRLECPIWGSDSAPKSPEDEKKHDLLLLDGGGAMGLDVMYQWNIRDIPEYSLAMLDHYKFTQRGRVVEITKPLVKSDAGLYKCSGVTGFGRKEAIFEVKIVDTNDDLLCQKSDPTTTDPNNMICFSDPDMLTNKVATIDALLGSSIELNCQAIGGQPLKYLWFMGTSVADWISNGQGVRGPQLRIHKVGREHIGHYTCQVRNHIGTLNYTYRLTVKEPASAIPRIIGNLRNYTFESGGTGILTCHIKCSCTEPIIQWLKRVEPHEVDMYKDSGKSLVPLPSPRESESNELYVTMEKWVDVPIIEQINEQFEDDVSFEQSVMHDKKLLLHHNLNFPSLEENSNSEHIFTSRLRLQSPITSQKHTGKYVVLTMSRANLKSIDYAVVYVHVNFNSFNPSTHNIIVYFVIPICLILMIFTGSIYFIFCRRDRHRDISGRAVGHRSFNHQSIFSPTSRNLSKKDFTAYKSMPNDKYGVKPASMTQQINGNDIHCTKVHPIPGNDNALSQSLQEKQVTLDYVDNKPNYSLTTVPSNYSTQLSYTNSDLLYDQQLKQQKMKTPPFTLQNGHLLQHLVTSPSSIYYDGTPMLPSTGCYNHHASNWRHPAPSVATEMSFDQYSAVANSVHGSSTSTSHYMNPFPEFSMLVDNNLSNNPHNQACNVHIR